MCLSDRKRLSARSGVLLLVGLVSACGGGSTGGDGAPAGGVAGSGGPPPPPPPPSGIPVVSQANPTQQVASLHPFHYDPTQGGRTFSDSGGNPLTYSITLGHTYNPYNDPNPPAGLQVEGSEIVGAPSEVGIVVVTVTATDRVSGNTATDEFNIIVDPNANPIVRVPNDGLVVSVGTQINYDATKAGTVFSDPDGDALTYQVSLRGPVATLSVSGTRITGSFGGVGMVEATVTATDAYGGTAADVFTIAAPAAEPGKPALPATSYQYDDRELPLPYIYQLSSQSKVPLWDSQPDDNRTSDAGATLGRVLFFDKRLSSTNTAACATCHEPQHGFAAATAFSMGPLGVPTKRNAMALTNVRYNINNAWFSDMRVDALRDLALIPIAKPEELGQSLRLLELKLAATDFYPPLFQAAFGTPEVTRERIGLAIEQFLQSLISYRAKFDSAYNPMTNTAPDPAAVLTAQELRGLDIFKGSTGIACASCHEVAAQTNVWQANNGLDAVPADVGTQVPALQRNGSIGVFRAASLRNIAVTAPYMHDGRFATLRDVIDHYDHGIVDSPSLDAGLRDLSGNPRRMNLSEEDKQALEAFLQTLTDNLELSDPKFSDPFQ